MSDVNTLLRKASTLHQQGKLAEAGKLYRKILSISPSYSPALNMLGILSAQQGDAQTAIDSFNKAIESAPRNPAPRENLAKVWLGNGDYLRAEKTYRQILEINPDSYTALFGLGRTLQSQHRLDEALPVFLTVQKVNAADPAACLNIGSILQLQGNLDDAALQFNRALALAPQSTDANACMASLHLQRKEYSAAEKYFLRAIELGAIRSDIESGLAQALEHQGNETAARTHYFKAVELDPGSQNAYILLDQFLLGSGGESKQAFLKELAADYIYANWQESVSDLRKLASMYDYPDRTAVQALQAFMDDYDPGELHDRSWWQNHINAFGGANNGHDKLLRSLHSAVYCWSLPDRDTLGKIAEFISGTRLCSYGAGSGVWERLLQQHFDIEVTASDINLRHRFLPMTQVDYASAEIATTDSIFFAWILRGDMGVLNIIKQMQPGQKLLIVGEPPDLMGIPRICATPEMWAFLDTEFTLQETIPLISYSLMNDTVSLHIKN